VIGLGLLGGSITLAVLRSLPGVKVTGYTHRAVTRRKARQLAVAIEIVDCLKLSVSDADLVILATPIHTFEQIFDVIGDALPKGCIVTDVGSTKVFPHRWAAKTLPKTVYYAGSHPIAGSEQRGIEFARDDLFDRALCVLTATTKTNRQAMRSLKGFWTSLGCSVKSMTPVMHDKIFADISHLPHVVTAALMNTSTDQTLKFAGKGFIDTSRIASGPANIWTDIVLTNARNTAKGIDGIIAELLKLKKAIEAEDKKRVEDLLKAANRKRAALINYKIKKKELIL